MKLDFIRRIHFKIASIIMAAFAVLIFFTSFYMYSKYVDFIREQAVSNAMQITEQINLSMDNYIKQISTISISAYTDLNVNSILENPEKTGNMVDTGRKMDNYFNNIIANRPEISGIAFALKSGNVFFSNTPEFKDISYNFEFNEWNTIFNRYKSENVAVLSSPKEKVSSSNYFILVTEMRVFQTKEVFGYMIFFLKRNFVDNILNNAYLNSSGRLFVLDTENNLILGDSKHYMSGLRDAIQKENPSKSSGTIFYDENSNQRLIFYNKSNYIGCTIVGEFELNQLMSGSKVLKSISTFTIIMALILSFAISIAITAAFSKDISKIIRKLQKVSNGETNVDFRTNRKDEIGKISNAISSMLEKIKEMSEKQFDNIKNSKEAVIKLREAEFQALQNQINPHFLYNTLDSIRMKALINKDMEVSEMVRVLSKLFRISINIGNKFVQVKEEIEHVKCYLEIQKFRFKEKIDIQLHIEEEVYNFKVIKLLLQPIVENAIVHGLEPKLEGGYVRIAASIENDELVFEICDNGVGINENKLKKLTEDLNRLDGNEDSIGLLNVNHRIKLYYGEAYGISLDSDINTGTKVIIKVPARR